MKLFFKHSKLIVVMKKEDLKNLLVIIRYVVTFISGLLAGNTEPVQTFLF